jgi:hypothetical protein
METNEKEIPPQGNTFEGNTAPFPNSTARNNTAQGNTFEGNTAPFPNNTARNNTAQGNTAPFPMTTASHATPTKETKPPWGYGGLNALNASPKAAGNTHATN